MLRTVAESERTQAALAARGIALLENERASYSQCFRKSVNVFVVQDGRRDCGCASLVYTKLEDATQNLRGRAASNFRLNVFKVRRKLRLELEERASWIIETLVEFKKLLYLQLLLSERTKYKRTLRPS